MKLNNIKEASVKNYAKAKKYIESHPHYNKVKTFMIFHFIKKYFIIGAILGVWSGFIFNIWWKEEIRENVTTYVVSSWTIINSIKSYWSAELVDEQQLRFNQQGEVTAVYFKNWDAVKKWDIIAELDKTSVENNIIQSEINLQNAKLQLDETLNGDNREAQILQAENNLEQSKVKLAIAKQEYEAMLEDQKYSSNTINDTVTTLEKTKLDIQNYLIEWWQLLDALDKLFWSSNKYLSYTNDTAWFRQIIEDYNPQGKNTTDESIITTYARLDNFDSFCNDWISFSWATRKEVLEGLDYARNFYNALYAATINAYSTVNDIYNDSPNTLNSLSTYKTTLSNYVEGTKNTSANILTTRNQINSLSNTANNATTLASKAAEVMNLESTIAIQENTLETTKNWTTEQQLLIAQNNIRQKELSLEQTKKDLDNLRIEAPFDGIIRKIDFKVGDKLTSSEDKYVYLENPNLIEISITLDQIDVVNVTAWMDVEVTMDAYPWITFNWVLWEVDSTPVVSNWVTSYTVKVAIDKEDKIIYSWMTATVKIIVSNKENVVSIPTTFIQTIWDRKIVLDEKDHQIEITIGSTDGTMTEIIAWLSIWQIIKKVTTNTSTNTPVNSNFMWWSMWWMWGWMWGWMWWWMMPR